MVKEPTWSGGNVDANGGSYKPYWSARVMFKTGEQRDKALKVMKYFRLNGFELRMLGFDSDFTGNPEKARNQSDKPCNICVKGLPPDMT